MTDARIPEITVVIPAYNAGKTLRASVQSVLKQTMSAVEVWIVEDGARDDTAVIADALAKEDSRVHVIHQENCGGYSARRAALKHIQTPYFTFVDADDEIDPRAYERMLAFVKQYDLDVAQCDTVEARTNGQSEELFLTREEVISKVCVPRFFEQPSSVLVWDKVYRTTPESVDWADSRIMMYDDLKINMQIFRGVTRVGYLHEGLYRYQANEGSSVRRYVDKNIVDLKEIIASQKEYAPIYGVDSDDIRLARWVVRTARDNVIAASAARTSSWRERFCHVRDILALPEVCVARSRLGISGERNRFCSFLNLVEKAGVELPVVALNSLKRIQGYVRGVA